MQVGRRAIVRASLIEKTKVPYFEAGTPSVVLFSWVYCSNYRIIILFPLYLAAVFDFRELLFLFSCTFFYPCVV